MADGNIDIAWLSNEIYLAAELLPSQGPITAFAFLNPLQGLETYPFDNAMRMVKRIYGNEPYLEESRYLTKFRRGRISPDDLKIVIANDLGVAAKRQIAGLLNLEELRMCMLSHAIYCGINRELDWLIAESNALKHFRSDVFASTATVLHASTRDWVDELLQRKLNGEPQTRAVTSNPAIQSFVNSLHPKTRSRWDQGKWESVCLSLLWAISSVEIKRVFQAQSPVQPIRHRDNLKSVCMVDCDQWVHEILVKFCAAFLDQGFANWSLPNREKGFFVAFAEHHRARMMGRRWSTGLRAELSRIANSGITPLESIRESLGLLGVSQAETQDYLRATMLALRGFSGMLWQTEVRPERVYLASPPGTLIEYLAVRLILDRLALTHCARQSLQYVGPLSELRAFLRSKIEPEAEVTAEQQAYTVFQLAQLCGWSPKRLASLSGSDWSELSRELLLFSSHERRRTYQAAFERKMIHQSLDAIAIRASQPPTTTSNPRLQIVCCLDAREESLRRHLEESDENIQTFGIAGFFGTPMYYRGAADAHFASLAPIVMRPTHWVAEEVVYSFENEDRNRARARKMIGSTSRRIHVGTRGFFGGAIVTTLLGPLATAPLLSRVLFPRLTGALHRTASRFIAPPAVTRLHLERAIDIASSERDDGHGFTVPEMAKMAELALRDIGLISNFAKLVMFMGHGSSCLNNPHESAYHCGACSGSPGGPNARALAAMLNDFRIRRILGEKKIHIPDETFFLGAMHNTATEEITFFDLELLPSSQIAGLRWTREKFAQVAERNAHERCRRFESAPLSIKPFEALLHVQGRAEDLAQTRPEYGNSTNALCFVGRRSRIRGLFLDRRSFLMSYDPTCDDGESSGLARILKAVIPVCQGINSLYTFSAMDSSGWGSGTKLPHNVTAMLGVMDGAASDLRTGIPWQGVDIHEPVRLLFVIESRREPLLAILDSNPTLARICRNHWAHLAILDPDSSTIHRFIDGRFQPYVSQTMSLPVVANSAEWYSGNRDNLPFARIHP